MEPTQQSRPTPLSTILRASAFIPLLIAAIVADPTHSAPLEACSVEPSSPLVVNVRDKGAKGNRRTDDTVAIQRAIDAVAGTGGTVYVPDGVFMVRGLDKRTLRLKSKMTLKLADRAVLKIIPNAARRYAVLKIKGASDVNVVGGTLQGDRKEHKGKHGEWGMGLWVGPEAARVTIAHVSSRQMWGDGFYVSGATNVALCSVVAEHNRRQGLSIIDAHRVLVRDSVFRDTGGTRPSAGIDLEPDRADQRIRNVVIKKSKFIDNAGDGIMIAGKKGKVANVWITENMFEGNRPILIENAPRVHSTQICRNRYIAEEVPASEGFNTFAEPVDTVALQADCGEGRDTRFETNRITKKNKQKRPAN
jgi:polygalacturonase